MQQTGDRTDLRDFRNMEMAIKTPYAVPGALMWFFSIEIPGTYSQF